MTNSDHPPDPGKRKRRQKAAQRETARKARQAERRHQHQADHRLTRDIREGRFTDDQ